MKNQRSRTASAAELCPEVREPDLKAIPPANGKVNGDKVKIPTFSPNDVEGIYRRRAELSRELDRLDRAMYCHWRTLCQDSESDKLVFSEELGFAHMILDGDSGLDFALISKEDALRSLLFKAGGNAAVEAYEHAFGKL